MLAIPGATPPPQNLSKIISRTKAPFCSAPRRHKPCFFIVLSKLKTQRDRAGTTRKVDIIRIVAIAAPAAPGLRTSLQPLELIQPSPQFEMILAATSQHVGKIGTWARPPMTNVTKRAIWPINALSSASQKTNISLGNLLVANWC